jgi:hypothetical protein
MSGATLFRTAWARRVVVRGGKDYFPDKARAGRPGVGLSDKNNAIMVTLL